MAGRAVFDDIDFENPLRNNAGAKTLNLVSADGDNGSSVEDRLRRLFDEIDTGGDGYLDEDEIKAMAKRLGVDSMTKRELDDAMEDIMAHSHGEPHKDGIDFDHFHRWWLNKDQSSRFGHATVAKIRIHDDVTPEVFSVNGADNSAMYLQWIESKQESHEYNENEGNSRESREDAALHGLAEAKCIIDPESPLRKWWDVSPVIYRLVVSLSHHF
jgi:hypothetical protein